MTSSINSTTNSWTPTNSNNLPSWGTPGDPTPGSIAYYMKLAEEALAQGNIGLYAQYENAIQIAESQDQYEGQQTPINQEQNNAAQQVADASNAAYSNINVPNANDILNGLNA